MSSPRPRRWGTFTVGMTMAALTTSVTLIVAMALGDRFPLAAYAFVMVMGPLIGIMVAASVIALYGRKLTR